MRSSDTRSNQKIGKFVNAIIETISTDVVNMGCGYDLQKFSTCNKKYPEMMQSLADATVDDRSKVENGIYKSLLSIFVGYRA